MRTSAPADRFASTEAMRLALAATRRALPSLGLPDLATWVAQAVR
jgi:hypothetical protein